jgi:hypothetical protein
MPAPTIAEAVETAWNVPAVTPPTSAAFTPLANSILVALGGSANNDATARTVAFTSNPALTWTQRRFLYTPSGSFSPIVASTAQEGATGVSKTVTMTWSAAAPSGSNGFVVFKVSSHTGVGASAVSTGPQTNTPTISITTTQDNSAVALLMFDWGANALTARTWLQPSGASAFVETVAANVSGQWTNYGGYYPDMGAAGTKTIGLSAPTSGTWTVVAVEVKGTATATAPDAPTDVLAEKAASPTSLAVSWAAPANDGGSAITGYRVTPYIAGTPQTPINTGSTATTHTVTGLTTGTQYTFTVAAINAIGTGPESDPSNPRAPTNPSDSGIGDGSIGGGSIALRGGSGVISIAPTAISSGEAFGTTVVAPGSVSVAGTGIASAETFGSATVTRGSVAITTTGIASAEVFGAASLSVGPVSLVATGIASAEAFGSHTVSTIVFVSTTSIGSSEAFGNPIAQVGIVGTGIASAESFGSATVVPGQVAITTTGISSAESFGSSTITRGAVTVSPTGIGSAEAFGITIVIPAGLVIVPAGLASAEAFGTTTVSPGPVAISSVGIASAEAFGTLIVQPGVVVTGIPTAEAFGAPTLASIVFVSPTGIASSEAFGSASVTPGQVNVVLDAGVELNGTNAYVQAADSATLLPETNNAFTFSFDFRYDVLTNVLPRIVEKNQHYICIMGDPTNGKYRQLGLEVVDSVGQAHEFWPATKLTPNRWYRAVVTFDGSLTSAQARVWLDGVEETVTPIFAWPNGGVITTSTGSGSNGDMFLGRRHTDQLRNLDGGIRRFRFWQRALTPTEAVAASTGAGPTSGLGVRWDFSEGSGTTVADASGNGNTGTLTNATWIAGGGGVPSAESFGAPTFALGPVSVAPTGIGSAEAFGTALVAPTQILTIPGIGSAQAFGTALVAPGPVVLTPTGISSAETFGTSLFTQTVAVPGIASGEAFGTAVITKQLATTAIPSAEVWGAPAVAQGAVFLTPSGIASAEVWGVATLQRGAISITVIGIVSQEAFGPGLSLAEFTRKYEFLSVVVNEHPYIVAVATSAPRPSVRIAPAPGLIAVVNPVLSRPKLAVGVGAYTVRIPV